MAIYVLTTPLEIYSQALKIFPQAQGEVSINDEGVAKLTLILPQKISLSVSNRVDAKVFITKLEFLKYNLTLGPPYTVDLDPQSFSLGERLSHWHVFRRTMYDRPCEEAIVDYLTEPNAENEKVLRSLRLAPEDLDEKLEECDLNYFRKALEQIVRKGKRTIELETAFQTKYPNIRRMLYNECIEKLSVVSGKGILGELEKNVLTQILEGSLSVGALVKFALIDAHRPDVACTIIQQYRNVEGELDIDSLLADFKSQPNQEYAEKLYGSSQYEKWLDYYSKALLFYRELKVNLGVEFCSSKIIEGLINVKDDTLVLKGYTSVFSSYEKFVQEVCIKTDKALAIQVNRTDTAFVTLKNFLMIALYRNRYFLDILGAYQGQGGQMTSYSSSFSRLNLVDLTSQIATNFRKEWNEWGQALQSYSSNSPGQYQKILDFVECVVSRSIFLPRSCSWYDRMAKRYELKNIPEADPEVKQKIACHPVPSLASLPIALKQQLTAFPVDSLDCLLQLAKEVQVQDIINKTNKGEQTRLFSFIDSYIYKFSETSPITDILAANLTFSSIKSLLCLTFSKVTPSSIWELYKTYKEEKDILATEYHQADTSGILKAIDKLKKFINQFYVANQTIPALDYQALAIALLKDEALNQFLSQPEVVKQIAGFSAAAQVPSFDLATAEGSIQLFVSLQQLVLNLDNLDRIQTFHDLGVQLSHGNLPQVIELINNTLKLVLQLGDVINVYLKPLVFPVQMLALGPIAQLLRNSSKHKKFINQAIPSEHFFIDYKLLFESYTHDSQAMGRLTSPISKQIQSKNLGHYSFQGRMISEKTPQLGETFSNPDRASFQGCAFEGFSFEQAHFSDLSFRRVYLEGCSFLNATFEGVIRFSETYIDAETASTFLPALSQALLLKKVKIEGEKEIILINLEGKKNKIQPIPEELKMYIEEQRATWVSGYSDTYLPAFEDPSEPALTLRSPLLHVEEEPKLQQPGYFNNLLGGIGAIARYSASYLPTASIAHGYKALRSYYTSEVVAEDLAKDSKKEKKDCDAWRKELVSQIQTLRSEIENERLTQQNITEVLEDAQESLKVRVEEQKDRLETLENELAFIQKQQIAKEVISKQQETLLYHEKMQVRHVLQDFLNRALRRIAVHFSASKFSSINCSCSRESDIGV